MNASRPSRPWRAVHLALFLLVAPAASAEPASEGPSSTSTVSSGPEMAKLLLAIRKRLGAPLEHPGEDEAAVLGQVAAALKDEGADASVALRGVREAVGAPDRPASPADDPGEVTFLRKMVASLTLPAAPPGAVAAIPIRPNSHPDPNVLEHSHMYFALHGLLFEAQIAPHIFFYDNAERLYLTNPGDHRWAHAWSFTPMIRVRNRNDTSGPIKTLSWMPKIDVQVIRLKRADSTATVITLHGTVGHQSNGQDECIFVPGVLDREDLCAVPQRVGDVTINYPNGSFSTNYIRVGVVHKRLTLGGPVSDPVQRTFAFGLYGETNPPGLKIGGTLPAVLRPLYGSNRLHGIAQFESRVGSMNPAATGFFKGSIRLNGWLDYIDKLPRGQTPSFTSRPNAPLNALYRVGNGSSRWRFGLEGAWNPDWLKGWGLEVRYDHGQDYYNLLFFQDIHWFQAGIVFDAAEFQPFKKR